MLKEVPALNEQKSAAENVHVTFIMSDDRTVASLTLSAESEITNDMLVEVFQGHIDAINKSKSGVV